MKRVTILDVEPVIAKRLSEQGVSSLGRKYLKVANILDQAGVIDHLLTMHDNGVHNQTSLLDMLEKAVEIGRIIQGDGIEKPISPMVKKEKPAPEIESKAPSFSS